MTPNTLPYLVQIQHFMQMAYLVAAVVVLFEALNKLERVMPFAAGLTWRQRTVEGLKALAWFLLGLGAGGVLLGPLLGSWGTHPAIVQVLTCTNPALSDVCVLVGFAVLIVRTRAKEG